MYSKTVPVAAARQHDTSRYTPYGSCGRPALPPPPPASSRAQLQSSEQRDRAPRCVSRRQGRARAREHSKPRARRRASTMPARDRGALRLRGVRHGRNPLLLLLLPAARHPPPAVPPASVRCARTRARARAPPDARRAPPAARARPPCPREPDWRGRPRGASRGRDDPAPGCRPAASERAPPRDKKTQSKPLTPNLCTRMRAPADPTAVVLAVGVAARAGGLARSHSGARSLTSACNHALARARMHVQACAPQAELYRRSPHGCGARRARGPRVRSRASAVFPTPPLFPAPWLQVRRLGSSRRPAP